MELVGDMRYAVIAARGGDEVVVFDAAMAGDAIVGSLSFLLWGKTASSYGRR